MTKRPIQPITKGTEGEYRFKPNAIVRHLLDHGGIDLNEIARLDFSQEDREQFAQLIGYSLSGFAELSYVSDDTYDAAHRMATLGESEADARRLVMEEKLEITRNLVRKLAVLLFPVHPDDLEQVYAVPSSDSP